MLIEVVDAETRRHLDEVAAEIGILPHSRDYRLVPVEVLDYLLIVMASAPDDDDEIGETMGEA